MYSKVTINQYNKDPKTERMSNVEKNVYYYEELAMPYINKVMAALEKRLTSGSTELTLKNGMELLVYRRANGDIQVYDDEPNLIAEFDNSGYNEYCSGQAMFNATVFIIRTSKRSCVH